MECINRKKVLMTERKLQSSLYQDLAEKKKLKRIFQTFPIIVAQQFKRRKNNRFDGYQQKYTPCFSQ